MKKLFSVLILSTLCIMYSFAQKFGAKFGANFSYVSTNSSVDYTIKPGLNASLFTHTKILPFIAIRTEFGYSQLGYNYKFLGNDCSSNIDYLQLSPNLYLKPPVLPIYAVGGTYAAYAISGYDKIGTLSVDKSFGDGKTLNFDYGVNFGLGYRANLAIIKLFMELRYEMGFIDYDDYSSYSYYKNRNLALSVGFMF